MNPIQKVVSDLDDVQLLIALDELSDCDTNGVLCDGVVRRCARKIKDITNSGSLDLLTAQVMVYKEGSHRWRIGKERGREK